MGKPERKDRERICSSSSYFLGCFGISLKIHSDKPTVDAGQDKKKKKKKKTRSRWFSRGTRFRLEDVEITTTPFYDTAKHNLTVENDKQNLFRVIRQVTDPKVIAAVGQETKDENTTEQRDINPDPSSFSRYDKCHQQASTRPRGGKLEPTKTTGSGSKRKKSSRVRKVSRVDPVIGISIIMLTLMIMLMWGRLCAILCTFTWCYFLPLLKDAVTAAKRNRSSGDKAEGGGLLPDDLDLNSEAYKKKVVMEGFLVRQRRVLL